MRRRRSLFTEPRSTRRTVHALRSVAAPLHGWEDLDPLMERIGDARFVLLGEASHGTAEFYDWRRIITQRLIREKGFSFIAVEGDWPDCYRVNRYIKAYDGAGTSARDVLYAFGRWPTWMWANHEVVGLIEWLRRYSDGLAPQQKIGFYGLDVYSLWESMEAVLEYLEEHDGAAAEAARRAFACFESFGGDVEDYAHAMTWSPESCRDEIVAMLRELRLRPPVHDRDGREAYFNAEQNALVAQNAEHYYRIMVGGDAASWNIRDQHMVETLNRLMAHHGPAAKAVVWAHNTHIGDARYTDMADEGMVNVGQLVREQHAADGVVLVGFSTYRGRVIAGEFWGAPMRAMPVPNARPESWDHLLHEAGADDKLLIFDRQADVDELSTPRGQRAIGVVYRPQVEAYGNYVPTNLARRYDALVHIEHSHPLHPLHVPGSFEAEVPETYPSGV